MTAENEHLQGVAQRAFNREWGTPDAAVPGDARLTDDAELTQDERRSLGCDCWQIDGVWQHKRGCRVPAVEAILRDRLPEATTVTEWGVRYEDGTVVSAGWMNGPSEAFARAAFTNQTKMLPRPHGEPERVMARQRTTYAPHVGPWEQVPE